MLEGRREEGGEGGKERVNVRGQRSKKERGTNKLVETIFSFDIQKKWRKEPKGTSNKRKIKCFC